MSHCFGSVGVRGHNFRHKKLVGGLTDLSIAFDLGVGMGEREKYCGDGDHLRYHPSVLL